MSLHRHWSELNPKEQAERLAELHEFLADLAWIKVLLLCERYERGQDQLEHQLERMAVAVRLAKAA